MKLNTNEYQVKRTRGVQLQLLSASLFLSYGPLIVFLGLICVINMHVHSITHSEFSQGDVSHTRMSVSLF